MDREVHKHPRQRKSMCKSQMCEKSWPVLEAAQQRVRCKAKVGKAHSQRTCMLSQGGGALSWRLWGARPSFQESEMTRSVFEHPLVAGYVEGNGRSRGERQGTSEEAVAGAQVNVGPDLK